MTAVRLDLRKLTPKCGAEVLGVDLSRPLDDAQVDALRSALAEHCVLFFRDQEMTPEQHKAFGRRFGELHLHPAWPRLLEGHPEVMEIYADAHTKRIAGEDWHSDVSCDPEPPLGTILYMLEVPREGGDTLFASMYAAYEALSAPMKRLLEGMTALHDGETTYRGRYEGMQEAAAYPRAEHPVIRTHPVSGRRALFVNRIFTRRILQLEKHESDAVLEMLFRLSRRRSCSAAFSGSRARWRSGTTAASSTTRCGTTTRCAGAGCA
ncbi:MAG: TauD/TfdA family dioxygenase [Burkholderiales bacterium]|nr:TauD/TfdA family dioxygenase [Burkholderiales bacterium]